MKQLIVISGTMGVGKTTVCQALNRSLEGSAWLDGDWCWTMNPWVVNDETRQMVEDNIVHMLRNFLQCSAFDTVLFSWVLHREEILDRLLERLNDLDFKLTRIALTCTQQELRRRMEQGGRTEEQIARSIERLKLCEGRMG